MSTNGSEPKALESKMWSNSEEVRHRFGGYRTISVVKLCGSAFTKESNSSPVPSIPGNSTSFGVAVGTEVMLAASPKTTLFESLLTEIHEATFAEALPRQDQDPNLPKPVAVSTGRCNTGLKFTRRGFKAQGLARALI